MDVFFVISGYLISTIVLRQLSTSEFTFTGFYARRALELAIVTVSQLNACHYCVAHHKPFLAVEGVSAAGADRLLDYRDHPELDEVDKLVVEYAIAAWEHPGRIPDSLFDRLRQHFSEAQIVELTLRITLCGFFNKFNDALRIEEEPEAAERLSALK